MNCTAAVCTPSGCCFNFHLILLIATGLFTAILFLQSGWDKINDRPGNLEFMKQHFQDSPLSGWVPLLLSLITFMELVSGTFALGGVVVLLWKGCAYWLGIAFSSAAVCLLSLFFGQRLAKDYAGAAGLVPYFLVIMAGLWLIG